MFPYKFISNPTNITITFDCEGYPLGLYPSATTISAMTVVKDGVTLYTGTPTIWTNLGITDGVLTQGSKSLTSVTGGFNSLSVGDIISFWDSGGGTNKVIVVEEIVSDNELLMTVEAPYTSSGIDAWVFNPIVMDATFLGVSDVEVGKYTVAITTVISAGNTYTDTFEYYYTPVNEDCFFEKMIDALDVCNDCLDLEKIREIMKGLEAWSNYKILAYAASDDNADLYVDASNRLENYCLDEECTTCR